jgi:bifunctional DNA-binding transcriptional regulator/antitoxin component of YhaV-PrlF toxin-antitoxin module
MPTNTDERGRIYLPADIRDEYGDEFRIVRLPSRVALVPVDEAPLEGLREAVGDAFEGVSHDELEDEALKTAKAQLLEERDSEGL